MVMRIVNIPNTFCVSNTLSIVVLDCLYQLPHSGGIMYDRHSVHVPTNISPILKLVISQIPPITIQGLSHKTPSDKLCRNINKPE